ncbi:polysaccharide biosynthesis tyrosine autokinase [Tessaracoccus aquimaris]|uniref:polysaccharide biosynthesis tyrosine autokinase n=1 Tax=Tessaracoccus aquimaris TaxID=1332264 RepID=UPI0011AB67C9|nr:polysaccharide biosynthesis tyrosine autokinase [Tessaracoccus aquimaris]
MVTPILEGLDPLHPADTPAIRSPLTPRSGPKSPYTSSASLFLSIRSAGTVGELQAGSNYAANQVQSFAKVAKSGFVLTPVIEDLQLSVTPEQLARRVAVTIPAQTATMDLAVTADSPEEAARIAHAITERLIVAVDELSPPGADGQKPVVATVIRQPLVPTAPTSPKPLQNLAIGGLVGLLLGAGQALLRDVLNTVVRSRRDIEQVSDQAILGAIPLDESGDVLVLNSDPHGLRAEAYRSMRTNLQFLALDKGGRSIVVTSSVPGEGKTSTAINLAATLAAAGEKVLLIDADLRRPRVAAQLQLEGAVGLTTVLIGDARLGDVVQPYGRTPLDVLTAGRVPPNPAELLGHTRMRALLEDASKLYDTVIIDSPPLLPVTDAAVLAGETAGVLVVVGSGIVRRPELTASLEVLERVEARVLGLVFNRVKRSEGEAYGYRHSYYSDHPRAAPKKGDRKSKKRRARAEVAA